MVIPEHLLMPVRKIQDTILICAPVISQFAALGALRAGVAYCREKLESIKEVRAIVAGELTALRDLCHVPRADGAFYFLLRVQTKRGAMELTEQLIREHGVAVIPGTAFGLDQGCHLRVAYGSLHRETASEGIGRLVKVFHLSWVSSITKIVSESTMQAAVSSVNCGLLAKPSAS